MHVLLVGNDKGGVGKDLVAEGLYIAALQSTKPAKLYEIETASRLARTYPEARFIDAGVKSAEEIYRNPDLVFAPLDEAAAAWRSDEFSIVSLGANMTSAFAAWSDTNGVGYFGEGESLTALIVLTMNSSALSSGLTNLYDLGRLYPACRRVAILNESVADFIDGDRALAGKLDEARGSAGVIETVKIRRMAAPAWGYIQNLGALPTVAQMPAQTLIDLGLPEGPSVRSMAIFTRWLTDDLIKPLGGLLPAQ